MTTGNTTPSILGLAFRPRWWGEATGSVGDERAFEEASLERFLQECRLVAAIALGCSLLFWPTDRLVFDGMPEVQRAFSSWRAGVVLVGALTFALLGWVRFTANSALGVMGGLGIIALALPAHFLGGLSDRRHAWFSYFYVAPIATVLLTLPLARRAALTAALSATCLAVYFAAAGQAPHGTLFGTTALFMLFDTASSVLLGHLIYTLSRTTFLQARALEGRAQKLEELDRLKSDFFANVSHELRTPLTLIVGALRELEAMAGERHRAAVARGRRSAARLLLLINELLDLAAFDGGRPVARRVIDVARALRRTASAFEGARGKRLVLEGLEAPVLASVDPAGLKKIAFNLLSNAFKFTGPEGTVRLSLAQRPGFVDVTVLDDGEGIAEDKHELVFARFAQVESHATRRHEGTGIGLALVREIAEQHGGRVTLKSRPGEGARFTVSLPIGDLGGIAAEEDDELIELFREAEPASRRGAELPSPMAPEGAPLVLVCEDNRDMAELLAHSLGKRYRLELAANGREGLEAARRARPDLVVTDVMMPEMSGHELVAALGGEPHLASTPVLVLSARARTEERAEALRAGASDYLIKPFDEEELFARVGNLLRMQEQRRALESSNERLEQAVAERTAELRKFAAHLERVREAERARIARELHDELGGLLTSLRLELDMAKGRSAEGSLGGVARLLDEALSATRAVVADLRPRALDERGFAAAAEELFSAFEARTGVGCAWSIDPPDLGVDGEVAVVAFRCLQESLTNVARHARAKSVEVRVEGAPGRLELTVEDDGVGLPEGRASGFGLIGMRERAQELGGCAEARRRGERGTRVRVVLPTAGEERGPS